MTSVLNKYPSVFENLFNLSMIIPKVALFVTVIRIIICVASTRAFHYKWGNWNPILFCTNISQLTFWRTNANDWDGSRRQRQRQRQRQRSQQRRFLIYVFSPIVVSCGYHAIIAGINFSVIVRQRHRIGNAGDRSIESRGRYNKDGGWGRRDGGGDGGGHRICRRTFWSWGRCCQCQWCIQYRCVLDIFCPIVDVGTNGCEITRK